MITFREQRELLGLLRKADSGSLLPADEERLRGLLAVHNPDVVGLPTNMLVRAGMIQLGTALLFRRLAQAS